MNSIRLVVAAVALAVVLASAAPVAAHVTVQPDEAAPASFARFVVRVPNERDAAATVKVEAQLPEEPVAVSFQPAPGWRRTVERKQRSAPVEVLSRLAAARDDDNEDDDVPAAVPWAALGVAAAALVTALATGVSARRRRP